jgi:hypothetical protein
MAFLLAFMASVVSFVRLIVRPISFLRLLIRLIYRCQRPNPAESDTNRKIWRKSGKKRRKQGTDDEKDGKDGSNEGKGGDRKGKDGEGEGTNWNVGAGLSRPQHFKCGI